MARAGRQPAFPVTGRLLVNTDRGQFYRFDTFLGHQALGKGLELLAIAMDEDHFEAPLMGDVGVERGLDDVVVFVFDIGDGGEEVALLVVVYHRDYPFAFTLDIGHPLVISNVRPDRVADSL